MSQQIHMDFLKKKLYVVKTFILKEQINHFFKAILLFTKLVT